MGRPPAVAAAIEAAATDWSTVTVPSRIAVVVVVGTCGAVGTKGCYPWDYCTWDRPDLRHGQWGTFESVNGPVRTRASTSTAARNYCNQTQPAMKVAYAGEVTMQWDHLNTVGIAVATPFAEAVGIRALFDRTRRGQCRYQIRSTDYN